MTETVDQALQIMEMAKRVFDSSTDTRSTVPGWNDPSIDLNRAEYFYTTPSDFGRGGALMAYDRERDSGYAVQFSSLREVGLLEPGTEWTFDAPRGVYTPSGRAAEAARNLIERHMRTGEVTA